ncbi:helveticin J family class III bacteriocin [Lentilactobacillus farraginis]|nr:helveticin J family class III bacteriocin [Lentilactobacillus farraginis]GAF37327.1 hypothetical protein JCM14108_2351 [Lentilactobacillus farraginis DSM 18382 = JCM 14108]
MASTVKSVKPTKQLTLTNLPSRRVVQKTYIDFDNYTVYALQQYGVGDTKNAVLSSGSFSSLGQSEPVSMGNPMVLKNFGHGETLEKFDNPYESGNWFWIATGANYDTPYITKNGDKIYWAHQIGIVKYEPNGQVDYSQVRRISSVSSLTKSGKPFGKLKRTDGALAANGRLIIWSQATDNSMYISCYESKAVLKRMYEASQLYLSGTDKIFHTSYKSNGALVSNKEFTHHLPWNSNQGLEFSNGNMVYITGGAYGANEAPHILKSDWAFKNYGTVSLSLSSTEQANVETEAPQLGEGSISNPDGNTSADYVYVTLVFHTSPDYTNCIYSVPKSAF